MKTLTFSNISVIAEDIYLKLRVVVHYQQGNTKLCPFFDLEFSKCSYSRALAPACGALVFWLPWSGFFFFDWSGKVRKASEVREFEVMAVFRK